MENTATHFLLCNGRLPTATDSPPAWMYKGWLLYYVQAAEMHINKEKSRWQYYEKILGDMRIPADPIPRVAFTTKDKSVLQHIETCCRLIGEDNGGWRDFHTFTRWLLFGLGLSNDTPAMRDASANEKLYRTFNAALFLQTPYDYFAEFVHEQRGTGWNPNAFFATPHHLCELITVVTYGGIARDTRYLTVCDPCTGTGRFLLHASNYSLRLYGQDIDQLLVNCCLINAALYAPWMAYPLPAKLFAHAIEFFEIDYNIKRKT